MASASIGSIVHCSPGRVRIRISRPGRTPETFAEIRSLLAGLPGVAAVEINPPTGSVLIHYDPGILEISQLLRLGAELGWISSQNGGAGPGLASWRSQVNVPRVAQGVAVLAAAGLGLMAGPVVGVSARAGSLSAAAALVVLSRRLRRAR